MNKHIRALYAYQIFRNKIIINQILYILMLYMLNEFQVIKKYLQKLYFIMLRELFIIVKMNKYEQFLIFTF